MTRFRVTDRALALMAAAALTTSAGPALAKEPKPTVIKVSAAALKDPSSRMCMPKTILPKPVDKSLPTTICKTGDEWAASGVTFVAR